MTASDIRRIEARDTHALRQSVLRPHQDLTDMEWNRDADGLHFGAFVDDVLVGVASMVPLERDGAPGGWRVRGMAVVTDRRRNGIGADLLRAAVDAAWDLDLPEVWCNARTSAAGFYARHGFEVVSETFELPDIGPHVVMRRTL